ncbi:Dockerin type I repeat protein [Rubripirellula lacrimiformis]|uniref:Dockerin type I repeat protein n=1 Tax=Rubripirellula lacrimiformis TaxID=1930273 RepID=A0A517NH86_9BACT|nr:choice-of-anchor Q domain-containing protein [Rubripirellula lacrimiformis]QDT06482.1 Dockerin type I repeat protein [Rubripirellula lacrimiformis]
MIRSRKNPCAGQRVRRNRRLNLETLENRRVLASFVVSTSVDVVDNGDAVISLREAVALANQTAGADTITFDEFEFFEPTTIGLTLGELEITDGVEIQGLTDNRITIDAQSGSRILRVNTGPSAQRSVSISDITLTGGQTTGFNEDGAAILQLAASDLTLTRVAITNNRTTGNNSDGGAISSVGPLTIVDSVISGNRTEGTTSLGGAITSGNTLTITASRLTGNSTTGTDSRGGAIQSAANLVMTDTLLQDNRTDGDGAIGGALNATGLITINGSRFIENRTTGERADGGAIAVFQSLETFGGGFTITQSDIHANQTGGLDSRGGGLYADFANGTISSSSITNNQTTRQGSHGGGVLVTRTDLAMDQSTISGNVAGGTDAFAGGIGLVGGSLSIHGVTITDNQASGDGGGVYFDSDFTSSDFIVSNSIVAGNSLSNGLAQSAPDVRFNQSNPNLSVQSSLFGTNRGSLFTQSLTPDSDGNYIGGSDENVIDPGLDPLMLAGNSRVHPLIPGSLAIDAGQSSLSVGAPYDQRGPGFDRLSANEVDMGSFELQSIDNSRFVVNTLSDELDYTNSDVSLREAIETANRNAGSDSITFDSDALTGSDTITLSLGQLSITDSVSIVGPGAESLTIDGDATFRVFAISGDTDVLIEGLTITGGRTSISNSTGIVGTDPNASIANGAGVRSESTGRVTLRMVAITDNQVVSNTATGAGVWAESGELVIEDSVVSNNIGVGVAVTSTDVTMERVTVSSNAGTGVTIDRSEAELINTTISANSGTNGGGVSIGDLSQVALVHATVFNNLSESGGGIFIADDVSSSVLISNSIVAGNTSTTSHPDIRIPAVVDITIASSLIGDLSGTTLTESQTADANGNLIGGPTDGVIDPMLGSLVVHGGDLPIHEPDAASPVINAGDDLRSVTSTGAAIQTDARGLPFLRQSDTVDMGAVELQQAVPTILWNNPDPILVGTPLTDLQLNATTDIPGTFVYSPADQSVLGQGSNQILTAVFTPVDTDLYAETTVTVSIDVVAAEDLGDAPNSYSTLRASNGPRHAESTLSLGSTIDYDTDGQPTVAADGDGSTDDGVRFATSLVSATTATKGSILINASTAAKLDAWIDFDGNGIFDTGEHLGGGTSIDVVAGENLLVVDVPADSASGLTYARFRISSSGGLSPTGAATDGEVEDYAVTMLAQSTPSPAELFVTGTQINLVREADEWVVRRRTVEVFRVPVGSVSEMAITGDEFSNVLTIDQSGGDVMPVDGLSFDGGDRVNTLRWVGGSADLDLTDGGNLTLRNIDAIDLTDAAAQALTIDSAAARQMDPGGEGIIITGIAPSESSPGNTTPGDQLMFTDGASWRMAEPEVIFQTVYQVITLNDTFIQMDFGSGWQNISSPSDVNNNGTITANDALVVINELGRRAYSDANGGTLVNPATVDPWPGFYYDQNGDGMVTALDALRVINQLARLSSDGSGSGESEMHDRLPTLRTIEPTRRDESGSAAAAIAPTTTTFGWLDRVASRTADDATWTTVDDDTTESDSERNDSERSAAADQVDRLLSQDDFLTSLL